MTAEYEIPSPDQLGPVHSEEDLLDRWRLLLHDEPFDTRTLWVTWYDEQNLQLPVIVPVDDLPLSPDSTFLENLAHIAGGLLRESDGGWVSCALARPGSGLITTADRRWADESHATLRRHGVSNRPLFLATSGRIRQLVLDEL